jgi:hypothetical protein
MPNFVELCYGIITVVLFNKKKIVTGHWWLTPIILAQEDHHPRPACAKSVCKTPSQWKKSWVRWHIPVIPAMAGNIK